MKKLALCSALALVSLNAAADVTPRFYAGLNLYSGSGTSEIEVFGSSVDFDYSASGSSLRGGYIFPSNNRFEISATTIHVDYEDFDEEEEFAGIDFDWKFTLNEEKITPYIGVGFGLYNYKDAEDYTADGSKQDGIAFNLMAGLVAQVHEHVEIDLSLLFKGIGWEEKDYYDEDIGEFSVDQSESLTNIQIGVSYLF